MMSDSTIFVEVTDRAIQATQALERVAHSAHGAETLFLGVVRDFNHGRRVVAVSYDAFPPLAEKTLLEICLEAQRKWGSDLRICVLHRTGRLGIGEASVVVAVGSCHRTEAFEASRYVIEELKVRVPIWKREHYEDGETEWLRGHALCRGHSGGRPLEPHAHG